MRALTMQKMKIMKNKLKMQKVPILCICSFYLDFGRQLYCYYNFILFFFCSFISFHFILYFTKVDRLCKNVCSIKCLTSFHIIMYVGILLYARCSISLLTTTLQSICCCCCCCYLYHAQKVYFALVCKHV